MRHNVFVLEASETYFSGSTTVNEKALKIRLGQIFRAFRIGIVLRVLIISFSVAARGRVRYGLE